jgi:hypothetical protein
VESIETLIRLVATLVAASLAPTPQYVDPGSELRMPLLSQSAPASDLSGVARWQQVEEVPSDLPDDATDSDDEALDADLDTSVDTAPGDEPLDAPLDDEVADDDFTDDELVEDVPVDADLASAQVDDEFADEPLDDEFGDEEFVEDDFADDELIDDPTFADEPLDEPLDGTQADTFAGDTSADSTRPAQSTSGAVAFPPGFGSGETIVRNPPAGAEAAVVPEDCDAVVQNGRAVVGVGCGGGSDDGPWWMPLVGQTLPAAGPSTSSAQGAEFPFNQSGPPPGFPFDDSDPSSSGGILIVGQAGGEGESEGRVELNGDPVIERSAATADRIYERDDESDGRQKREGERAEAIREERANIVAGLPTGQQAEQSSRPGLRTATQPASARKSNRAKANADKQAAPSRAGAKLNPCQNAKRLAQNPESAKNDKQLAKARANCKQFKKAQR